MTQTPTGLLPERRAPPNTGPIPGRRDWLRGHTLATRRTGLAVAGAILFAVALRVPFVGESAYPDEGGYLLVADQWHISGPAFYGDLFVDRPPLLMLFWRAAAAWGGVETARWLACTLVAALVACAGWAGRQVGGHRGAVWSSLVTAALASTPTLGANEVDGELLAVPLVMASCALTLVARRGATPRAQAALAAAAGVAGGCALLVKQNFVDGLVFATVLVAASALQGSLSRRVALRLLGWGAAGGCAVGIVTAAWAGTTRSGLGGLAYVMYGFRADAGRVILSQSLDAPLSRLVDLAVAALVSGVAVIAVLFLGCSVPRLGRREPLTLAIVAMLAVGVAGIALGASYWSHYLVGLIPVLALAVASLGPRSLVLRRVTIAVVALVVAAAVAATTTSSASASPTRVTELGLERLLAAAAESSDTAVVTYGHANVIEASGLRPGYPYLWSLPMRVLDPRLRLMTRTLAGGAAPTWFVEWEPLNSWDIDAHGRLAATVDAHYHQISTVCGVTVFLHNGVTRPLPDTPDPCTA